MLKCGFFSDLRKTFNLKSLQTGGISDLRMLYQLKSEVHALDPTSEIKSTTSFCVFICVLVYMFVCCLQVYLFILTCAKRQILLLSRWLVCIVHY